MIEMLRSLFRHQAWADAAALDAIKGHPEAAQDAKLRGTLHHTAFVQRAFLCGLLERPIDYKKEMQVPETLAEVERIFCVTGPEEVAYVDGLEESALVRPIPVPWFPGARFNLGEVLMQVVMHSQHHRGQCLARLRELGGVPPTLDFIVWVKDRE